jgi:hypothetical protein
VRRERKNVYEYGRSKENAENVEGVTVLRECCTLESLYMANKKHRSMKVEKEEGKISIMFLDYYFDLIESFQVILAPRKLVIYSLAAAAFYRNKKKRLGG